MADHSTDAADRPGHALLDAVCVVDVLRSPGGCPWDAEQTHASLAPYLIEETYETLEAIETADPVLLREELGDLLFQVLFHARLAEELPEATRFTVADSAEVHTNWEAIKRAEKHRTSAVDGVPMAQPALALAAKLASRAHRAGVSVDLPAGDDLGARLFALAAEAAAAGLDPETELRRTARDYAAAVRSAETDNGKTSAEI